MRQEKTLKVRLNQFIGDVELQPNAGSDKAWTWRWQDYATDSGEAEVHSFAIRFRSQEIAQEFLTAWNKGREENKKIAAAAKGETTTEEAAAAPAAATEEEAKAE